MFWPEMVKRWLKVLCQWFFDRVTGSGGCEGKRVEQGGSMKEVRFFV